ncbi:MAG TPA: HypC/HybG/HupF family hydrogenase formation chaperone [Desulfobacteraceae bacterium]|nr:HypC/HybG/HupF family hydrogenase formation chaperone [Desulfobacteraceae bacterium]
MCIAVPGRVTKTEGNRADVEFGGVKRYVSLALLENISVGDYLIVHAGFAIHKIDPFEAEESIRLFQQILKE